MRANELIKTNIDGITLHVSADGAIVTIRAEEGDKQVGYVVFDRDGKDLVADDFAVDSDYRGRGIGTAMYNHAKSLGFKIKPSSNQTTMGQKFWKKKRQDQETVWEDPK
jgi:ribosomal protein S18 acetylase RimI-like enzyme